MLLHHLKLNDDNPEFVAQHTRAREPNSHQRQQTQPGTCVVSSTDICNWTGGSLATSAYYHLRNAINNIRHLLTLDACHAAVRSIVLIRHDHCNALLGGMNNRQLDRLQGVQNSAARVIHRVRQREHITPTLRTLHWLQNRKRIIYKICTHMAQGLIISTVLWNATHLPVNFDRPVTASYLK